MTTQTLDQAKLEAFMGKAISDLAGATSVLLCYLGDRLGLFKALASEGSATSDELAERTGLQERYLREWLNSLSCNGYLEYDPASRRFSLPPEHAPALADEDGPAFLAPLFTFIPSLVDVLDGVAEAFRNGGGVPIAAYSQELHDAAERATATWFDHLLLPVWLPAMPDVEAKLRSGASLADLGCGHGKAVINLARAFPTSRFTGYDIHEPNVIAAMERARAAGVDDRVHFAVADIEQGLPEQFDIITTFDVVHDLAHPRVALQAIRQALKPDGILIMLEFISADTLEGNAGPLGAAGYAMSLLYCMTTSLAAGGEGLGSFGLPEPRVRELCAEAGFSSVRVVPVENPRNVLYEIRA